MEAKSNSLRRRPSSTSAEAVDPANSGDNVTSRSPEQAASRHHLLCTNKDPYACAVCSGAFEVEWFRTACCGSHFCKSCCNQSSQFQYDEKSVKLCTVCRKKAPITERDQFRMSLSAARRGEAWAQFAVARHFDCGRGVGQSHSQAMYWYKKAAEQGHPLSFARLGIKYECGQGCTADPSEAERLYRMAADLPIEFHREAKCTGAHNLALLIGKQGRGEEARDLLLPLGVEGNALIQVSLGDVYLKNFLNAERAVTWYRSAAIQGHSRAAQNLVTGYMCLGRHALAKFWINVVMKIGIGAREGTLVTNMTALRRVEEHCGACDERLGKAKQNMCKQCRTYCYCNRLCQIRHWNRGHRTDCKEVRNLKEKGEELIGLFKA